MFESPDDAVHEERPAEDLPAEEQGPEPGPTPIPRRVRAPKVWAEAPPDGPYGRYRWLYANPAAP